MDLLRDLVKGLTMTVLIMVVMKCRKKLKNHIIENGPAADQGCISCGILVSGIRARGVSSEHMENMEMFSCSPT